jgi:hypothetical protein
MTPDALNAVRLEPAGPDNSFVHDRATDDLIGRVWQEPNGEWWATFYLGEGATARSVSGGKFDSQGDAVAEVWVRSEDS